MWGLFERFVARLFVSGLPARVERHRETLLLRSPQGEGEFKNSIKLKNLDYQLSFNNMCAVGCLLKVFATLEVRLGEFLTGGDEFLNFLGCEVINL